VDIKSHKDENVGRGQDIKRIRNKMENIELTKKINELQEKIEGIQANSLEHVVGHLYSVANLLNISIADTIIGIITNEIEADEYIHIIKTLTKMSEKL
jgi:hypothetical protein